MKNRLVFRGAIAAALPVLLAGCVIAPVGPYHGDPVSVAPPEPHGEVIGVAPALGYFWIGGHWRWRGHAHFWVPGYWHAPRYGYRWSPHRWHRGPGGWREAPGHWRRY